MAPKQAQDTSAALSETFTEWLSVGNIATREDVQGVRDAIAAVRAATREDMQELRNELREKIAQTHADTLKWMFGAIGAQTVVLLGALFGLIHNTKL